MFRALIVDDEYLMRDALKMMISKVGGIEVVYCSSSGEEAVEICRSEYIDIVFMDIVMPGISGIEAGKKIHRYSPDTAIYIISSYSAFSLPKEAAEANIRAFIPKPVSFSVLEDILNDYKKNFTENPKLLMELFSLIESKDYRKTYSKIPEISNELYGTGQNLETIMRNFLNIGRKLLNYTAAYRYDTTKKCEEMFPLEVSSKPNRKSFEFWLFNVIDYVFEQRGIQKNKVLENIFIYINDNIKGIISLNDIVENCSISQGYLSRIFRSQYNVSVMEYIHIRKIQMAKSYLILTDLSVADIAFELSYNESSYFSKVFKKYENLTILQYRKIYKL